MGKIFELTKKLWINGNVRMIWVVAIKAMAAFHLPGIHLERIANIAQVL